MSIIERINNLGIERIMIIDSKNSNIEAAKSFFDKYQNTMKPYYFENPEDSIKSIERNKYDLILTDDVFDINGKKDRQIIERIIQESSKNYTLALKVCEIDYKNDGNIETHIYFGRIPILFSESKKNNPITWEGCFNGIINDETFKKIYSLTKECKSKPSEENKKMCLEMLNALNIKNKWNRI